MLNLIAFLSSRDRMIRLAIAGLQLVIAWLYRLQREPVWRSADGRVTPIRKMDDRHLVNSMALLIRQGERRSYAFLPMHNEIERRGLGFAVDVQVDRTTRRRYFGAQSFHHDGGGSRAARPIDS